MNITDLVDWTHGGNYSAFQNLGRSHHRPARESAARLAGHRPVGNETHSNTRSLDLPRSSARVPSTTIGSVYQVERVNGEHLSAHVAHIVSCPVRAVFISPLLAIGYERLLPNYAHERETLPPA